MGFSFEEAKVGRRVKSTNTGKRGAVTKVYSSTEKEELEIQWEDDSVSTLHAEWCLGSTVVLDDSSEEDFVCK